VAHSEDPLEGLPELRVEDGVDDWVDAGVDIALSNARLCTSYIRKE
jgi:hypothetical protein